MRSLRFALVVVLVLLAGIVPARADLYSSGFEAPAYSIGSINGQDGWKSTGPYDQMVTKNGNEYAGFGLQSFRISNSVTSGNFGDQTFSKSNANEAGEADAVGGGLSGGTRTRRFDSQWNFASATQGIWQPGLSIDVSPDRGDGARMSLVRMRDTVDGFDIDFMDYLSGSVQAGCSSANFRTVTVSTNLGRFQTHSIRLLLDFADGPRNDLARVYVDNSLRFTGTTWEDFYRECQAPSSRTVDSLLFRATGSTCESCDGAGFVIDNLQNRSVGVVVSPKTLNLTEGGPSATYTVKLDTQPLDFVRVIPAPGPGITVSPAEQVFTSTDFNLPKTFTVTAVDDSVAELPSSTTITHSVASFDGHYDGAGVDIVTVNVADDDGVFVLSETDGVTVVSEAPGFNDHYSFSLLTQPTSSVTITATADSQLTVTPASRTFTTANWNVPQEFTVVAVDDAVIEGTHTGVVTHVAASADPGYGGQPVPSVTATIFDNDPSDNIPPAPPVITNCPGGPITTKTFALVGTSEPSSAIETYVNNVLYGSAVTDPAGDWTSSVAFAANGTYSITARAFDGNGNVSLYSAACVIVVNADFTPPAVPTIISPSQNAYTGTAVTVTGNAFGDTVSLTLFDGGVAISTISTGAGSWSIPRTFATGVHTLTARATDAAGNVSNPSAVRTFTVDGDPPVVTNFAPPGTLLVQPGLPVASYYVHGTAFDALTGVNRVEIVYQDLVTGDVTTNPASCSGCPSAAGATVTWGDQGAGLIPGLYAVEIRAYDGAGNIGTAGTLLLFIA